MKNTKPKVRLWSVLTGLTAILTVAAIVGNIIANQYATTINVALNASTYKIIHGENTGDTEYFKKGFASDEEREAYEAELCATVEAEGAALLKNENNALPLASGAKVSLFGHGSVDLMYGGTGSGKTTLANALIAEMVHQFPDERHVIIEDTREIQCTAPNAVFFHTTDDVSMTKCLKQTLRFRPTRIHVGEVRDEAALDLLDAWNTGHSGGISTVHANSALQGLSRVRGLVSRSPSAPRCVEEVIGEAVQVLVFIERTPSGRRIREILAVDGYSIQKQEYQLSEFTA